MLNSRCRDFSRNKSVEMQDPTSTGCWEDNNGQWLGYLHFLSLGIPAWINNCFVGFSSWFRFYCLKKLHSTWFQPWYQESISKCDKRLRFSAQCISLAFSGIFNWEWATHDLLSALLCVLLMQCTICTLWGQRYRRHSRIALSGAYVIQAMESWYSMLGRPWTWLWRWWDRSLGLALL